MVNPRKRRPKKASRSTWVKFQRNASKRSFSLLRSTTERKRLGRVILSARAHMCSIVPTNFGSLIDEDRKPRTRFICGLKRAVAALTDLGLLGSNCFSHLRRLDCHLLVHLRGKPKQNKFSSIGTADLSKLNSLTEACGDSLGAALILRCGRNFFKQSR